jgi:O-antigen ligase
MGRPTVEWAMIKNCLDKNFTALFLGLLSLVLIISIGVPRAGAFAAPVAGLILLVSYWIGTGSPLKLRWPEFLFMAAVPVLASLSSFWAIDPAFAIDRGYKIGLILIFGLFFIESARRVDITKIPVKFVQTLCVLYTITAGLIALEIFWDMKLYRLINNVPDTQAVYTVFMNRSLVVITTLFLPLMLLIISIIPARKSQYIFGSLISLALAAGLMQTESQSAQLFMVVALVFLFAFPVKCRTSFIALGAAIIALALIAPWFAQYMFKTFGYHGDPEDLQGIMLAASIPHRLEVWNFVATEAIKSPLYGQGIEAIRFLKSDTWLVLPNTDHMLHPHNAVLQLWVEFGVVGITLGCGIFIYMLHRIWQAPILARRFALAIMIATLAVLSTGYGLWQSWLIGLLVTLTGFTVLAGQSVRRS